MSEETLHPQKWVQNGVTLAHNQSGKSVFVHGALPGESIQARTVRETEQQNWARTIAVESPAPERIDSDCDVFPLCGGCSFRHISYTEEVKLKEDLLLEFKFLSSAIGEARAAERYSFAHAEPNAYRNHIQVQVLDGKPGFFAAHTNEHVAWPGHGCRHISRRLNDFVLDWIGNQEDNSGLKRATFREHDRAYYVDHQAGDTIQQACEVNGESFDWEFPARSFFQPNRFLFNDWLQKIFDLCPDGELDAVELFCGNGLIGGVTRHRLSGRYLGFDSDRRGLKAAKNNFAAAGWHGEFIARDLYRSPAYLPDSTGLLLANPPRAGIGKKQLERIVATRPRHILYSSCMPATLNRDLGYLTRKHYQATSVHVFDFFPRTPHVEVLMRLDLRAS